MSVGIDVKNTNRYAVIVEQSGLPMDRDYYLKDDKDVAKVREAYRKHLSQMFTCSRLPA
jgi:predicted metalloendopeptidase